MSTNPFCNSSPEVPLMLPLLGREEIQRLLQSAYRSLECPADVTVPLRHMKEMASDRRSWEQDKYWGEWREQCPNLSIPWWPFKWSQYDNESKEHYPRITVVKHRSKKLLLIDGYLAYRRAASHATSSTKVLMNIIVATRHMCDLELMQIASAYNICLMKSKMRHALVSVPYMCRLFSSCIQGKCNTILNPQPLPDHKLAFPSSLLAPLLGAILASWDVAGVPESEFEETEPGWMLRLITCCMALGNVPDVERYIRKVLAARDHPCAFYLHHIFPMDYQHGWFWNAPALEQLFIIPMLTHSMHVPVPQNRRVLYGNIPTLCQYMASFVRRVVSHTQEGNRIRRGTLSAIEIVNLKFEASRKERGSVHFFNGSRTILEEMVVEIGDVVGLVEKEFRQEQGRNTSEVAQIVHALTRDAQQVVLKHLNSPNAFRHVDLNFWR